VKTFWTLPLVVLSVASAQTDWPQTSVAKILNNPKKLNGTSVILSGQLGFGAEVSYFADDSHCKKSIKRPCKLAMTSAKDCRVIGNRYSALGCGEAIRTLLEAAGVPYPLPFTSFVKVKRVTVSGIIKAKAFRSGGKLPPQLGFGHLGAYPGEISAAEWNLDGAEVISGKAAK
jgi:hypothetical protein